MVAGAVSFAVANVASAVFAWQILARLGGLRRPVDVTLLLLLRLAFIAAVVLVAGVLKGLSPLPLAALSVGLAAPTLYGRSRRETPATPIPSFGWPLLAIASLLILRVVVQAWFLAPYSFDALSYHLPKVGAWIRAEGFTREMGVDSHSYFPAGFELYEAWWVAFFHHDVLIEMAEVEFLALGFSATYVLARKLELGPRASFLAALLYATIPGMLIQITSCLNDLAASALLVSTAAVVVAHGGLPAIALPAALGIAVKPTYAYALPGMLILFILARARPPEPRPTRPVILALLAMCVLIGGFFYVRNALWYGNPIYPVGAHGLFGTDGEKKIQLGPSLGSAVNNFSALAGERVYDRNAFYTLLSWSAGWGPLAFACGPVALILMCRSSALMRHLTSSFGTSLACVLLLVNSDPWCMRFVLFFPVTLCVASAWLLARFRPLLGIAALALAYQFLSTILPGDIPPAAAARMVAMPWRERSHADAFGARHGEASVAYWVWGSPLDRGPAYLLYRPDFSANVVYPRVTTGAELERIVLAERITSLYLYRFRSAAGRPAPLEDFVRRGMVSGVRGNFYTFRRPEDVDRKQ